MGGGGGKSFKPAAYTPPPPPAEPETLVDDEASDIRLANEKARKAAALAGGRQSTILTGTLGDTSTAFVAQKNLLGQ